MRINNNLMAMNTHRQLSMNTVNTSKSMEKLSSGFRINRAADDAAGLSISEKMRGQIRGLNQAARNAQDGVSLIQTAEGAMDEISNMLVRMKELNVQKLNGTYNADDTGQIDLELDELGGEIDSILADTEFNDTAVFTNSFDIAMNHDGSTTLTVAAATFTGGLDSGSDVAAIEAAVLEVNTDRSTYGAQQNRLESAIRSTQNRAENLQASESRIRDVDMAKEMMEFTKNNILTQAAQAMLAQANQAPQGVLQLLR